MRLTWLFLVVILAIAAISVEAKARLQTKMLCWDPDMEFPVACDEEDD